MPAETYSLYIELALQDKVTGAIAPIMSQLDVLQEKAIQVQQAFANVAKSILDIGPTTATLREAAKGLDTAATAAASIGGDDIKNSVKAIGDELTKQIDVQKEVNDELDEKNKKSKESKDIEEQYTKELKDSLKNLKASGASLGEQKAVSDAILVSQGKMTEEQAKLNKELRQGQSILTGMSKTVRAIGLTDLVGFTGAAGLLNIIFVQAAKIQEEFHTTMFRTIGSMEELREMTAELRIEMNALGEEAVKAMKGLRAAGITTTESFKDLTEQNIMFARATGVSNEVTAEFQKAMSVLGFTADETEGELAQYAEASRKLGLTTKDLNIILSDLEDQLVSLEALFGRRIAEEYAEQLTLVSAAARRLGMDASAATGLMRKFTQEPLNMIAAAAVAGAEIDFDDPIKSMENLLSKGQNLADFFEQFPATIRPTILAQFGLTQQQLALAKEYGNNIEGLKKLQKEIKEEEKLTKAYEESLDNLYTTFKRFVAGVGAAIEQISKPLTKFFTYMSDILKLPATKWFVGLTVAAFGFLAVGTALLKWAATSIVSWNVLGATIGGNTAAQAANTVARTTNTAATIASNQVLGVNSLAYGTNTAAMGKNSVAMLGMGGPGKGMLSIFTKFGPLLKLLMNPLTLVVALVVAIGAAFVSLMMASKETSAGMNFFSSTLQDLKDLFVGLWDLIKGLVKALWGFIKIMASVLTPVIFAALVPIRLMIKALGILGKIMSWVSKEVLEPLAESFQKTSQFIYDGLVGGFESAIKWLKAEIPFLSSILDWLGFGPSPKAKKALGKVVKLEHKVLKEEERRVKPISTLEAGMAFVLKQQQVGMEQALRLGAEFKKPMRQELQAVFKDRIPFEMEKWPENVVVKMATPASAPAAPAFTTKIVDDTGRPVQAIDKKSDDQLLEARELRSTMTSGTRGISDRLETMIELMKDSSKKAKMQSAMKQVNSWTSHSLI